MKTERFDVLVQGGELIDGRKRPRYRADVGIRGSRIVALGDLAGAVADRVVDAGVVFVFVAEHGVRL